MNESFKNLFTAALFRSGKTNAALAKDLGVSDPFIHYLLSGRKKPTISRLESIKEALRLDAAEYKELLNALIKEDSEFHTLAHHLRLESFSEFYVPFLRSALKASSKIRDFKEKGIGILDSDFWLGHIDILPQGVRSWEVYRIFFTKPTDQGIGVSWSLMGKTVPAKEKMYLSIPIGPKDIAQFDALIGLEQPIRNALNAPSNQQRKTITES